ncbi:MAG TPA: hypothetical protein VF692_06660, partial [Pyrinomonadaceae bacterium]
MNTYANTFGMNSAADALPEERAAFIRKTYLHLAGAIFVFVLLEAYLMISGAGAMIAQTLLGGRFSWFLVLAGFLGVSMLAQWWANSQTSKPMQYMGLALYVVAQVIIFAPLLYISAYYAGADVIAKA